MAGDVVLSYDLPCSPRQAFFVYVDGIGDWWPPAYSADPAVFGGLSLEPWIGGRLLAHYGNQEDVWGEVQQIEPGEVLEHTFAMNRSSAPPSLVAVLFEEHDTGTRMTFRHGGWTAVNAFDRHKYGDWPIVLGQYVEAVRLAARPTA